MLASWGTLEVLTRLTVAFVLVIALPDADQEKDLGDEASLVTLKSLPLQMYQDTLSVGVLEDKERVGIVRKPLGQIPAKSLSEISEI